MSVVYAPVEETKDYFYYYIGDSFEEKYAKKDQNGRFVHVDPAEVMAEIRKQQESLARVRSRLNYDYMVNRRKEINEEERQRLEKRKKSDDAIDAIKHLPGKKYIKIWKNFWFNNDLWC